MSMKKNVPDLQSQLCLFLLRHPLFSKCETQKSQAQFAAEAA